MEPCENLSRDELMGYAAVVNADHAGQDADGFLLAVFWVGLFEGHANEGVRRPQLFAAQIETALADIEYFVRHGSAAGPIVGDQARKRVAFATTPVAAEGDRLACEPALNASGKGDFFFRSGSVGAFGFSTGL